MLNLIKLKANVKRMCIFNLSILGMAEWIYFCNKEGKRLIIIFINL